MLKQQLLTDEHGHSDILDYYWSNIMHNTLSEGLKDRDEVKLDHYHLLLAEQISEQIIKKDELYRLATGKWEF